MSPNLETKRVKETLELQVTAVKAYASRLSAQNVDGMEFDLDELERAVTDLRGMIGGLPHAGGRSGERAAAPAGLPATSRPEREAKGDATAAGTQRPGTKGKAGDESGFR